VKRKIIVKDNMGENVTVDAETFIKHIKKYHSYGISIHEERGYYFTVDDDFRKMLKLKIKTAKNN
tara:strand:- start:1312 stop:1506 length:195 start_codon:yes stop_codon:yes gene_type:complete